MRDGTEAEAKLTLGQVIGRTASSFPHQPAIVSATFAPLTYRDLQRQLDGIRRRLRLAGFDCNVRIGVLMPNGGGDSHHRFSSLLQHRGSS